MLPEDQNSPVSNSTQQEENTSSAIKLDYTITDPQQRNKLVHTIINQTPPHKLTPYYLEQLTKIGGSYLSRD